MMVFGYLSSVGVFSMPDMMDNDELLCRVHIINRAKITDAKAVA